MRTIVVLVALAGILAGCGGGGGPETAGQAAKRQYEMLAKEQYGRFYDELHPAFQATISRDDWVAKQGGTLFSIKGVRVIESYDEPFRFSDGTRTVTAVTLGLKAGIGALPSVGDEQTTTVHEEQIDGRWRLFQN